MILGIILFAAIIGGAVYGIVIMVRSVKNDLQK